VSTDVTVEQQIDRPRPEVASYASDWRNDPAWIGALSDVRLVTDGPFGVGSQVARVASFLGKKIEYVNEVVGWDPGTRLEMRSVKAPFPMTVVYEFEDAGHGATRMRIRAGGDATGFYKLAGPLLNAAVRKGISGDLKRLKRLLEAS
jgi:uncharacterized membrane protein